MKLQKDIREFVELFLSKRVKFLLVGGYALAYHGAPRFTEDIDFLVERSAENAGRIVAAIREFGFGALGITESDIQKPDMVIQLGRAPNRIDLLTGISGVSWDEAWNERKEVELGGLRIAAISSGLLIRNKEATGRTRDLADIERLKRGRNR